MSELESPNAASGKSGPFIVARRDLQTLIDNLMSAGFTVIGPTLRDSAISYDAIDTIDELPLGWTDRQEAGSYRLERRSDSAVFGYNVGPQSWKTWLYPSTAKLWSARRSSDGMDFEAGSEVTPRYAFVGVRACELSAIKVQDRVLHEGTHQDPHYSELRDNAFIVAVNCVEAGATCFCTSMKTGPKAQRDFDLSLTELIDSERHDFLVDVGSAKGAEILNGVPCRNATSDDISSAEAHIDDAAQTMGRQLETDGIKELLQNNLQHSRWDDVAERCLSCGNCTNVCPTCFCATIEDVTDLTGQTAERHRNWASCFSLDFSYIHDTHVRPDTRSRYRQWLTHKLANWIDQFGTSGCVGCGRCITWCPVAIDITEEVAAIRDDQS